MSTVLEDIAHALAHLDISDYDWQQVREAVERAEAAAPDVERLALYIHQARTSNEEPVYDMAEARRRAEQIAARLLKDSGEPGRLERPSRLPGAGR